jgi:hypothetical protein
VIHGNASAVVAAADNQSGADYITYADGDPAHLFAFSGLHAYADRRIWALLETKLRELRAAGASSIGILDAGWPPWCIAGRTAARRWFMASRIDFYVSISVSIEELAQSAYGRLTSTQRAKESRVCGIPPLSPAWA